MITVCYICLSVAITLWPIIGIIGHRVFLIFSQNVFNIFFPLFFFTSTVTSRTVIESTFLLIAYPFQVLFFYEIVFNGIQIPLYYVQIRLGFHSISQFYSLLF